MKKIVLLSAMFALLSTAVFAQSYEVYNELGSDIVRLVPEANAKVRFAGFYDEVYGRVSSSIYTAEARYRLGMDPVGEDHFDLTNVDHRLRANVWFRPASFMELVLGNDYYMAVPGSYMVVYDEYLDGGRYGKNGFGASFVPVDFIQFGFSIPEQGGVTFKDDFNLKFNLGGNFNINNMANVGVSFLGAVGGNQTVGIYGNYTGSKDFYIGGGYTYDAKSLAVRSDYLTDAEEKLFSSSDHLIDVTGKFNFNVFRFGFDFEIGFQDEDRKYDKNPLYVGLLFELNPADNFLVKVDGHYKASNISDGYYNRTEIQVYPRVIVDLTSRDELGAGFEFTMVEEALVDNTYHNGFSIPVYWKHYFN